MYIQRHIADRILKSASKMPVITITGPRQSGKTTLAKHLFPDYTYANFELPSTRDIFNTDPIVFLKSPQKGIIIDEFQNLPEALSYIMVISDENEIPGRYILTGSQNFLMLDKISQSLAGRTSLFNLPPFSIYELKDKNYGETDANVYLYKGFYPRVYADEIDSHEWLLDYINLYLERDVRSILNVKDLSAFSLFLKLCAGRTAQALNLASIADIVGRDIKTLRSWLSVLETSYIVYLIQPYYRNFNKRLTKAPKLFFYDTGIVSTLLDIKTVAGLESHYLRGQLFENFVMSELMKYKINNGIRTDLYYWCDKAFAEIDCVFELNNKLNAIEIKSSSTYSGHFIRGLEKFHRLTAKEFGNGYVIYSGDDNFTVQDNYVIKWTELKQVFE